MDSQISEIVIRLKEEKARRGLSVNKIFSMVEEKGFYSSLTTAKRIFAEGSERVAFKYETLKPYTTVLFNTDEPTPEREEGNEEQAEEFRADLENIKELLQLKNNMLEAAQKDNATLTLRIEELKEASAKDEARSEKTISFLRRTILALSISIGVVIAAFIAFLVVVDLSFLG